VTRLVDAWLEAALDSLSEVATTTLGIEAPNVIERMRRVPRGMEGALIPIVHDQSMQIGIFTTSAGSSVVARALLCMEPEDDLSAMEIADAIGEIANIVAGGAKKRMSEIQGIKLGLPIYFRGDIEQGDNFDVSSVVLDVMGHPYEIMVLSRGEGHST
jgi:CheY-specific phosphatase CheX